MTKPPGRGEKLDLAITGLNHRGQGVGRHGELVVFVPYACPGDEIRAEVTAVKRGYATARLLAVTRPSPDRIKPACPVFGNCGGCTLQHIAYGRQLALKTELVRDVLTRLGGFKAPVVRPCLGMDDPWGFRGKAGFPVGGRRGRLVAGFYAAGSHRLVPVESCPVQHPVNNRIMAEAVRLATKYGLEPYNERTGRGTLRHVLAKVATGTGQAMAVLVTNQPQLPGGADLARELAGRVPELAAVVQNVNPERTNRVLGRQSQVLWGAATIEDRLGGLRFRISAESFVQTNPAQAEVTYDLALAYAAVGEADTAVDAYCGIGTITLILARRARAVYGVENVAAAVADARHNAELNDIANAEFICGDVAEVLPDLARRGVRPAALVLDPPRKGVAPEVVAAALAMAPARIVYVSCAPATLARDLARLAAGGYELVEVQPVDMFPHTAHVEAVAWLC